MKTHLLILTTLSSISMAYSKPKISEELQLTNQPPGETFFGCVSNSSTIQIAF